MGGQTNVSFKEINDLHILLNLKSNLKIWKSLGCNFSKDDLFGIMADFGSSIWMDGSNEIFDGQFAQIKTLVSLLNVWVNVKISACGFVPPEKD